MRVGLGQISPVMLDRKATTAKMVSCVKKAAADGCRLVAFGEAVLPGYPIWISRTDGARFDAKDQKKIHAHYVDQAVVPERGDLDPVREAARAGKIAVIAGVIERAVDRGGHSLYCSLVYIDPDGDIGSVHRKLMPTFEERLAWGPGDGSGLVVHDLEPFRVGALNCWENWMPLARAALYAAGENLHVAIWPGCDHNTRDITRFIARESRSYVVSVSGLLAEKDFPAGFPHRDRVVPTTGEVIHNGGSAVAGPDGEWLIEPVLHSEGLITCDLDEARVREERQNFDPSGHYARPDVLRLTVNRRRQSPVDWIDDR